MRLGGDEFLLLIDLAMPAETVARAHEIVAGVASADWAELASGLRVTVSAGHAAGEAWEVDHRIQAADANLYRAKASGRGRAITHFDHV